MKTIDKIKYWWLRRQKDRAVKKHNCHGYFKYARAIAKIEVAEEVKQKLSK
jgi:hypothetical protein